MTTTRPDEVRFYLDEVTRTLDGTSAAQERWQQRPAVRATYGVLGALLLGLSAYEFATDGFGTELFVYVNVLLGLALLATAFDIPGSDWLWGRSPHRPFLALRPDGLAARTHGTERVFAWAEIEAIEQRATALVVVPREGSSVEVSFSALSYERVQEVKAELLDAARGHNITVR